MQRPIIEVRDLVAGYAGATILNGLSFDVMRGEVFVILGGSGCGKSTLLKHLIGLVRPKSGRIAIEGQDLATAEGGERLAILRRMGVLYQSGALFGSLTLLENVMLPLEEFTDLPRPAREAVAMGKLQLVGLDRYAGHSPSEVSGGMKKRAGLARAMALDPPILFLDEPSAGLDPVTSSELDDLIVRLSRGLGVTIVLVTHELASILAVGDRAIMLEREAKGIIAQGAPRELHDRPPDERVGRFFRRESASRATEGATA